MAYVNVLNVQVLDNPSAFVNPFQFEITFECVNQLKDGEPRARRAAVARYQSRHTSRTAHPRRLPAASGLALCAIARP